MIRKISKSDLKRCSEILETAYSGEPYNENFLPNNSIAYISEKFNHCKANSFVIIDGEEVRGFVFWTISCWSNGLQAVLEEIVIAPECQGKGMGSQLIDYSLNYLKKLGVKSMMLWALKNPKVSGFHEKNGFDISDEHCVMFKNI